MNWRDTSSNGKSPAPVADRLGHLIGVGSMTDIGRNMAEASDIESSRSSSVYRDIAAASRWRIPGSTTLKKAGGHGARCHDAGDPPGAGHGLRGGSGTDHGRSAQDACCAIEVAAHSCIVFHAHGRPF
jgi:hypothetical protein